MQHASFMQLMLMAAIVATLLLPPAGGLVWLACAFLDASFGSLLTFGQRLPSPAGVLVWWAIAFVPALAYAGFIKRDQ